MASYTVTPVEKGIMRCKHTGVFSPEDVRSLASFFHDYRGKLLLDLSEAASVEECAKYIRNFRPMMPTAAIFGAELDSSILDISESYYTNEVRLFETEQAALAWLREQ